MTHSDLFYDYISSPFGQIEIAANNNRLCEVRFASERLHSTKPNKIILNAQHQLEDYFAGRRFSFDLPLDDNGTIFQKNVWQALHEIPYGATCSYRDIAALIGRPKAVRAVGAANGRNRFSIIVPCHRVVGADGSLTGYAWGVSVKAALLHHELHFLSKITD
jgi:methylated-DNA-[protein]-cysteine S-methyltransferase